VKRFHVRVSIDDLDANIRFYSTIFGTPPTVREDGYAKWMIGEPRVDFAISRRGAAPGVDHLGLQVDSDADLKQLRTQAERAQICALDQTPAQCCYARSDEYWITDPQGIAWETFDTLDAIPGWGDDTQKEPAAAETASTCCTPRSAQVAVLIPVKATGGSCC
jgi:catechol 2,3-dioxygenase-like lactoylglutathione lyase family enzyme